MRLNLLVVVLVVCALLASLRAIASPQAEPPDRIRWEYLWTEPLQPAELNQLGEDGWELVAVEQPIPHLDTGLEHASVTYSKRRFYFKRRVR